MKKIITILSMLTVMMSFTACGSETDNSKLQSEYEQLKQDYEALKADYDELKGMNSENVNEQPTESTTEGDSEILPLEIEDYGYYMSGKYLYCSVIMHNPNKNIMFEFPSYRVTARDAENVILGSDDQTLCKIYPEQSVSFTRQFFECEEAPSKVDVEALGVADYNIKKGGSPEVPDFKSFEIKNTAQRDGKVVGEITNPNDYDFSQVAVSVIFRDESGSIIGGQITYVSDLKANSTAPFQISTDMYNCPVTENYEITAQPWI